jgi:ParB-like chromosome segregation protein Spo0J
MPPDVPRRALASLLPAAVNARTHTPDQVTAIAASMVEFGFNDPVEIDAAGTIVAGHGRVLAAHQLGLVEVPVVVLDHLTDVQRRAYLLANNRLAELAGWDRELLGRELTALADLDVNLAAVGFSDLDVNALTAPVTDPMAEWQDMPEFQQGSSRPYQMLTVHLRDAEAVQSFAALIGQPITTRTRFIRYPAAGDGRNAPTRKQYRAG